MRNPGSLIRPLLTQSVRILGGTLRSFCIIELPESIVAGTHHAGTGTPGSLSIPAVFERKTVDSQGNHLLKIEKGIQINSLSSDSLRWIEFHAWPIRGAVAQGLIGCLAHTPQDEVVLGASAFPFRPGDPNNSDPFAPVRP